MLSTRLDLSFSVHKLAKFSSNPGKLDFEGLVHLLRYIRENNTLGLKWRGPARGYYPEPIKSILVVSPGNVAHTEEHFRGLGIRVGTGNRYLGGFIGDADAEREWLREKV